MRWEVMQVAWYVLLLGKENNMNVSKSLKFLAGTFIGLLVGFALVGTYNVAYAGERGGNNNPTTNNTGIGVGIGVGGAGGAGGDATGGSVDGSRSFLIAPPSMPAPAVSNIGCPPIVIGSEGFSFLIGGRSWTKDPQLVAFCVAMALNQPAVAQTIACTASKEYRQANNNCVPDARDVE